MEDSEIVELYWERDDKAIFESDAKYGHNCRTIAYSILHNQEDVEECVNDTWLGAWNAMPPNRPNKLRFFLARITRNLSFNRLKSKTTVKRGNGEIPIVLDELYECVPNPSTIEDEIEVRELERHINQFLHSLPERSCNVFLRRYWYVETIAEISERYDMTPANVKVILSRTRGKLKNYLGKEDISL